MSIGQCARAWNLQSMQQIKCWGMVGTQGLQAKPVFYMGGPRPHALLENKKIFFLTISYNILYLNYEIKRSIAASWRPVEAVENARLELRPAGCGMQNRIEASKN